LEIPIRSRRSRDAWRSFPADELIIAPGSADAPAWGHSPTFVPADLRKHILESEKGAQ
jgi:hypothetical protein